MIEIEYPVSDLGFGVEVEFTRGYPEGYQNDSELIEEWKMQREILRDLGVLI